MPITYQELRLLLVSPGDVASERKIAGEVVDELNRDIAPDRGYRVAIWRWETDARPGLHILGPQGLIDDLMTISTADVVVGVFWKRFGTPVWDAASGTEHELRRAWASWRSHGRPDVMVYFGTRAAGGTTPEDSEQATRIRRFKRSMPEEQLWWSYRTRRDFERLLRQHLTRYLLGLPIVRPPAGAADEVSPSIRQRFAELNIVVERLTARQTEVIEELTDESRVLISGAAGSGKTLVAAQKALRTAKAGYSTLFVCHNPLLAD
jgi:hypothetical protein